MSEICDPESMRAEVGELLMRTEHSGRGLKVVVAKEVVLILGSTGEGEF